MISSDEAVTLLQKGDRISYGHATGEPQIMSEAMVKNQKKLEDFERVYGLKFEMFICL